MNTPVMITVLCGPERDGWLNPQLVDTLLAALYDGGQQGRQVVLSVTCGVSPVAAARNKTAQQFLTSPCQWLVQIDNDVFPQFRILDLIKAAEGAGKSIVGAPTPIKQDRLLSWNVSKDGKDFIATLPLGWFSPYLVGAGLLAVHRHVFEQMPAPWFDSPTEDFRFCIRAQENARFKVWAHSGFTCGHLHTVDLRELMPK